MFHFIINIAIIIKLHFKIWLNACYIVNEKLMVFQLVKIFPAFYWTHRHITVFATSRYSEPDEYSPHFFHPEFLRRFIIVSPYRHTSILKGSLSLNFSHQYFALFSHVPMCANFPAHFILCDLFILLVTGYYYRVVSYKASHANTTVYWSAVLPIWVLIIHDTSTRVLCCGCRRDSKYRSGEKLGEKYSWILPTSISFHTSRVLQHAIKSHDMGQTALLPLRRKSC
jgi:hypothetical protein